MSARQVHDDSAAAEVRAATTQRRNGSMQRFSWSTRTIIDQPHRFGAIATAIAAAALLAGCADATGTSLTSHSQLAFSAGGAGGAAAALAPQTVGGHTLDLTQATLTIDRAELKSAASDVCADDNQDGDDDVVVPAGASADRDGGTNQGDHGHDCPEIKVGPQMVNLPLDGNLVTIPADSIPAGTFRQIELRVSAVELKGTFDGVAFDDTIPVHARAEIEFDTPVVVVAGQPTTITVNVPVNTWLVNADGSLVDPTTLLTSPNTLAQVKNRIAASLRAFEDNDHDGHDDHGGHGRD
jgi:hypothetical protein